MALTVRFPDGTQILYNFAEGIQSSNGGLSLVDDKGKWGAFIIPQPGMIIEAVAPCAIALWKPVRKKREVKSV